MNGKPTGPSHTETKVAVVLITLLLPLWPYNRTSTLLPPGVITSHPRPFFVVLR